VARVVECLANKQSVLCHKEPGPTWWRAWLRENPRLFGFSSQDHKDDCVFLLEKARTERTASSFHLYPPLPHPHYHPSCCGDVCFFQAPGSGKEMGPAHWF
jgi:hypothetical protein